MSPGEFSANSPGRLENTTFREHRPSGEYRDVEGRGFVPNLLPPALDRGEVLIRLHEQVTAAERALSHLEGMASRVENPAILMNPFQFREARLSSAIENTFASAQQMALFSLDPSTVETQKRTDVREVNNYVSALQHGFQTDTPICLRLIREMHGILLEDVDRKSGRVGNFRNAQNAIGRAGASFESARFVPPPPRFLPELLENFETYLHSKDRSLPRLVRFAIAHYQFECIHPFDDGNGRIGRLLIALQLCEQAQLSKPLVYVSGYFEKHRSAYYDLLYNISTRGEWLRWISFFLQAIAEQANDASSRFAKLADLRDTYHKSVREKRASALLPTIVDQLFAFPAITVSAVQSRTGLSPSSAGVLVRKLVDKKILTEATGRRSHRVFLAPEIIEIIDA